MSAVEDAAPRLIQIAHGNQIVQAVNSVVTVLAGGERVTILNRPQRIQLPKTASAARLLAARSTPVPFLDRGNLLKELLNWIASADPFAVRVIGGQGGSGKTRLAIELCHQMDTGHPEFPSARWLAGFLPPDVATAGLDALAATPMPRLIVVDYAESRPLQVTELLRILSLSPSTTGAPVRIMLMVRRPAPVRPGYASDGSVWVDALRTDDEIADIALDQATETILDEKALSAQESGELFRAAVTAFSVDETIPKGEPNFTLELFAQPLMVVTAAFLAARDAAIPATRAMMFDAILAHEERHWVAVWGPREPSLGTDALASAVALATLTDCATPDEGNALLRCLPEFSQRPEHELQHIQAWLASLYPPPAGTTAPHRWGGLEPDALGEYLVAQRLGGIQAPIAAALNADRAVELLERPLTVLTRAASVDHQLADTCAEVLARQLLGLVMRACTEANNPDLYRAASDSVIFPLTGLLETLATRLARTVVAAAESRIPLGHYLLAPLGTVLAKCVLNYARQDQHLSLTGSAPGPARAQETCSHLPSEVMDQHVPGTSAAAELGTLRLGRALNNYAIRLADVGRRHEALAPAEEALRYYRALQKASPGAHTSELALALNSYASRLVDVGRRDEALAPADEAVGHFRALVRADPSTSTPDLAGALGNYANLLSRMGRPDVALEPAQEAVAYYRELARTNSAAYIADLARVLDNYASLLSELGRWAEALAPAEEAVDYYRGLVRTSLAAYTPDLGRALNNYALRLKDLGRRREALAAAEEAVAYYRGVVRTSPAAFMSALAEMVNTYAVLLSELDRRGEALARAEEALGYYRDLVKTQGSVHIAALARVLNNYAIWLSDAGRTEEACARVEEAVGYYRGLAKLSPAAYTPDLAMALNTYAIRLSQLGRPGEACARADEAVGLYRALVKANAAAYVSELARALGNYGNFLSEVGQRDDALGRAEEAVGLYRALVEKYPMALRPRLAIALTNYAKRLSEVGRSEEACARAEEAVGQCQALVEVDPAAHARALAIVLTNYADRLSEAGRPDEARRVAGEARNLSDSPEI